MAPLPPHWHANHSELPPSERVGFMNKLEASILAHKWLDLGLKLGLRIEGDNPWSVAFEGRVATISVEECTNPDCRTPLFKRQSTHHSRSN